MAFKRQQYCRNGHELTPENTVRRKSRNRHECRICCNERRKRKYLQAKGAVRQPHGKWGTKVYRTWYNIKERLKGNRPLDKRNYTDRGIKLLFDSFEEFYEHVGDPPGPEYSIDRINNDGHYERGNLRWATRKEQGENRYKGWRTHSIMASGSSSRPKWSGRIAR